MVLNRQDTRELFKGRTIVAADDDIPSIELLQFILTRHGACVLEALNGAKALELVRSTHPDLVIIDLTMPVMNGWDLISEIRRDQAVGVIPAVALTAHAMVGVRQQVLNAGFDAYFSKPYHPIELVQNLADVLHKSTSATSMVLAGSIESQDISLPTAISG